MADEFTFHIDGSYKPSDLPLERLGEYLIAMAELLGESANVHFDKLTEGSAVVYALVDTPAVPKVERRMRSLTRGGAPANVAKAFRQIDDMLRDDNAVGRLSSGGDNIIHVEFAGRNRPAVIPFGPIKQIGVIEGEVFRVQGRDDTVHVGIMDGTRTYKLEAPSSMGHELAALFRTGIARFRGEGTWYRHESGEWELKRFKIESVKRSLREGSISSAVQALRAIGAGDWTKMSDPLLEIGRMRGEGDSEH
jgi:hypothetical protein